MKGIINDLYSSVVDGVTQLGDEFKLMSAHMEADFKEFTQELGIGYFSKLSREQLQLDKAALAEFANNFYWGNFLSDQEAKTNLERGIVEIVGEGGGHSSNGLLITRNGYVITSHHCVDDLHKGRLFVRRDNGQFYRITKVVFAGKGSDIALVKADKGGPAEAIRYRFAPKFDIAQEFPVAHYSYWNQRLKKIFGIVRNPKLRKVRALGKEFPYGNQVEVSMKTICGDSGGIVATKNSEIYGVVSTGNAKDVDITYCTFWFEAIAIINGLINYKKKAEAKHS
ncbi:trypsin-like peptidase domain-containing protein [bacterium]|nr:MAG: trypsin-like peptidase domain-containing protein [bacterium]